MSTTIRPPVEPPARRFLHICYCCSSTDAASEFFSQGVGLREVMRNPIHPSDGSLLGIDGEIVSGAAFLYDARGPRTSPSVEVQEWVRPGLIGRPLSDPTAVGMQAVGFATADPAATIEAMVSRGAKVVARGAVPWAQEWSTLADPTGALIDIVGDARVPVGESRFRHLRITVTDLEVSLPWYHGMGFVDVDNHVLEDGSFVGVTGSSDVRGRACRLRLPDENCEVVLVEWTTPRSHGRHPVPANQAGWYRTAVCVDDTRASYEEFLGLGWTFEREPREVELEGTKVPDMWICFLNDPDGVPFEFVQRPRSAFRPERPAS